MNAYQLKNTQKAADKDILKPGGVSGVSVPNSAMLDMEGIGRENNTGIPDGLKDRFERKTGMSFDGVKVHYNSAEPKKLGAHAYAQGEQIFVGPGQEGRLEHELGHIVQQRLGMARPTASLGGVKINYDPRLEAMADQMAGPFTQEAGAVSGQPLAQLSPELDNVLVNTTTYNSKPRDDLPYIYRMFVDPKNDLSLRNHIELAQAFASPFPKGSPERVDALMRYAQLILKIDEAERDANYKPTGEKSSSGKEVHAASLGKSLNTSSACRELSAFMQILLAQEGIRTHMTVGMYMDRWGGSGRHAWLTTDRDDIIDPTTGDVFARGDYRYHPDIGYQPEDFAVPIIEEGYDFDRVHDLKFDEKWKPSEKNFFQPTKPAGAKFTAAMDAYKAKQARMHAMEEKAKLEINDIFENAPFLLQLEHEGKTGRNKIFSDIDKLGSRFDLRQTKSELLWMSRNMGRRTELPSEQLEYLLAHPLMLEREADGSITRRRALRNTIEKIRAFNQMEFEAERSRIMSLKPSHKDEAPSSSSRSNAAPSVTSGKTRGRTRRPLDEPEPQPKVPEKQSEPMWDPFNVTMSPPVDLLSLSSEPAPPPVDLLSLLEEPAPQPAVPEKQSETTWDPFKKPAPSPAVPKKQSETTRDPFNEPKDSRGGFFSWSKRTRKGEVPYQRL